jgi:hypothetical protein
MVAKVCIHVCIHVVGSFVGFAYCGWGSSQGMRVRHGELIMGDVRMVMLGGL